MTRRTYFLLLSPLMLVGVVWTPLELAAHQRDRRAAAAHRMAVAQAESRIAAAHANHLVEMDSSREVEEVETKIMAADAERRLLMLNPPRRHSSFPFIIGGMLAALPYLIALARDEHRSRIATRRLRAGLCVQCGYDLRASTSRCPECGHSPPCIPEATINSIVAITRQ